MFIRKTTSVARVPAVSCTAGALIAAASALAWADPAENPPPAAEGTDVQEVLVTGSRIARPDYDATSPVVSVDAESITKGGTVNIENTLNQLPQFVQGQTQSTVGAVALPGRATLNLRGLGETRNLVLLDGRRLPLSSAFAVVDVNLIPPSILSGVETVSGGASAVYGSDAMSGVVNFKTREHFDGVQLNVRSGFSDAGGAGTLDGSLTGGFSVADDRGHMLLSAGYTRRNVLFGSQRDFYQLGVLSSFIGQGTYVPDALNLPQQAAVNTVFANYGAAAGSVLNSRSLGFNDNGTLFSQIGATNYQGPSTQFFSTTGGIVRQPVTYQEYVLNPLERKSFFGKFSYNATDTITPYVQFLYNRTEAEGQVGWSPTLFVVPVVPVTNPFIPADLRAILASRQNPNANFTLNERFMGFDTRKFPTTFTTAQYVAGVRGTLPFKDWSWDVYGSYDSTDMVETQNTSLLLSRMSALLFAADGGASICAGGFNPFGLQNELNVSAACRNYIQANTHDFTQLSQDVFEGTLTGSLFPLPAGNAKFSLTVGFRQNSYELNPDPSRENNDIIGTLSTAPAQGKVRVKEAAVEFLIPVLKDAPFAKNLDVNLGFRTSDYDITGRHETYKIDGLWRPVNALTFRGGYERAIRAPNIGELFSAAQAAQAQIGSPPGQGDPCDVRSTARTGANGAQVRGLCIATGVPSSIIDSYQYTTVAIGTLVSGSTLLTPEKADTLTGGLVFRPAFETPLFSDVSFSADYYDIDITNVIDLVSGVTAMNKCYNLDGSNSAYAADNTFCSLISRDATGGIRTVFTPYLNLGRKSTTGVDLQLDWKIPFGETAGSLDVNLLGTITNSYKVKLLPGNPTQEFSGTIDGTQNGGIPIPDWKSLLTVTYSLRNLDAGIRWHHLPSMDDVTSVTRPASPAAGVPSYDLFDVNLAYRLNDAFLVRGGVTNLFDKDPPIVGGTVGQTQPGTYDIIGRAYFMDVQINF
jgi:iron complex outermembrane receptor protein